MKVTVFYAWQSDSPEEANRFFIRDAAKEACKRINDDPSNKWDLKLDSDTQGTAGMCDIPATILSKIESCDIFLCDLTLVGQTFDGSKKLPNSNVVFELGFAANAIGFESIVAIVNEAKGYVNEQVFDVKRRNAITYSATTKDKESKEKLAKTLEGVFRLTIKQCVEPARQADAEGQLGSISLLQENAVKAITNSKFHGFFHFPATVITAIGTNSNTSDYDPFELVTHLGLRPKMKNGAIVWNEEEEQVFEFRDGQRMIHANGNDYLNFKSYSWPAQRNLYDGLPEEPPLRLSSILLQTNLAKNIYKIVSYMNKFGVEFPLMLGVSLIGVEGLELIHGNHVTDKFTSNEVHLDPLLIEELGDNESALEFASRLVPIVNQLCRQVGMLQSDCVGPNDTWVQRF